MKKLFLLAFLVLIALPAQAATIPVNQLAPGNLIRGSSHNAVYYYGVDGMRYVFPNVKTYFTWYSDFNSVTWVSDQELASIQIGGNVTYKPGIKLLKIISSPTVYAVDGGSVLRPISSEQVAEELYGTAWNTLVDDVPDGFFSNYTIGAPISLASTYDPVAEANDAYNINNDKNLKPFIHIYITDSGYNLPTTTIPRDTAIRFVNNSTEKATASEWDGIWGSGTLNPGEHFTRYFRENSIGRWNFYNKYKSKETMQGTLIVE